MRFENESPIVVGGLGGSGTRVVAQILQSAGVYIGNCLNEPLDALWFTLLFRRPRGMKSWSDLNLQDHLEIFHKRMHGVHKWNVNERGILRACAWEFALYNYVKSERFGFPFRVYNSFFKSYDIAQRTWGWKEPNAHLFLPSLAARYPNLRYIHTMRHPLDIAFGSNHQQVQNWKHLFDIDEPDTKRAALRYYEAANNRAINLGDQLGKTRFFILRHEALCHQPVETVDAIINFCDLSVTAEAREQLYKIPKAESVNTNYENHDFRSLMPYAKDVAEQFSYSVA